MKRGFYTIMSAQFFSSLADNACSWPPSSCCDRGPEWQRAALVPMFALFYVVLAPFVGAFADALPKGKVMFISNAIKVVGCLMMLFGRTRCWPMPSSAWARRPTRRPSTAS
jgi:MFS family permease